MCTCAGGQNELEKLRALLCAERSRNQQMTEIISSLKQDKELLQHELTKKAELICDFLQDKLRPGRIWCENPPTGELSDCTVYPYYPYDMIAAVKANCFSNESRLAVCCRTYFCVISFMQKWDSKCLTS